MAVGAGPGLKSRLEAGAARTGSCGTDGPIGVESGWRPASLRSSGQAEGGPYKTAQPGMAVPLTEGTHEARESNASDCVGAFRRADNAAPDERCAPRQGWDT